MIRMGVVRVLLGFIIVYSLYIFGDFENIIISTLLIQYSMPIATTSYLFALSFNSSHKEIAVMTVSKYNYHIIFTSFDYLYNKVMLYNFRPCLNN